MQKMEEDKIVQYILGNIGEEDEKNKITEHLLKNNNSRQFYSSVKNSWALSKGEDYGSDLENEYKKLSSKIDKPLMRFLRRSLKYAATLVIAFVSSFFVFNYLKSSKETIAFNEVKCPPGQIAELVLSDGTQVWLNSGSNIRYPSIFNNEQRDVVLSGEAFFDVSKNLDKPFIVGVKGLKVKVLGTNFNVNAYDDNQFVETTLVEGKVQLLDSANEKIVDLKPGELAKYDRSENKLSLAKVDTRFYSSWKEGKITFYNEELGTIMKKLERWYNVEFTFKNEHIKTERFTGTILKHKPLYQVLEIIKLSSSIDFEIIQNMEKRNQIILTKLNKEPM